MQTYIHAYTLVSNCVCVFDVHVCVCVCVYVHVCMCSSLGEDAEHIC